MKILFRGLYISIARIRLKNLLTKSNISPLFLIFKQLVRNSSKGDVYDALMRNQQELQNVDKQFRQLVNNTDAFLEAVKQSYENADNNIVHIINGDITPILPVTPVHPVNPITPNPVNPITPVLPLIPLMPNKAIIYVYKGPSVPTYNLLISPALNTLAK